MYQIQEAIIAEATRSLRIFIVFFCLAVNLIPTIAWGEADGDSAQLFGAWQEKVVSTSRLPQPISRIAENVTVITSDDIVSLNARTLDEVLQTVSGIQLFQVRTPGSTSLFTVNGSLSNHVLVLIDGIPQNPLGTELNAAELGMIPVQRIERIEIVKGAASVAWGPALGGAVNIITRDSGTNKKLSGIASASYGENTTSDMRGGVNGKIDRLGYYIDGGRFHSNGLLADNQVTLDHVFGKLMYDLPSKGRLSFGADFRDGDREVGHSGFDTANTPLVSSGSRFVTGYLKLDYPLHDQLNLEILTSVGKKDIWQQWEIAQPNKFLIFDARNQTDSQQASARLIWDNRSASLVVGFEYLHDGITVKEPETQLPMVNFSRNLDRYAAFLNGSYTLGPVTLLSGIRFDHIDNNEQVASYNLGATWQLTDNTLLRVYGARGYSLPTPNFQKDTLQNIWTVQAGIESSAVPFLWLKGTLFYSDTWNIQTFVVPPDYPLSPVGTVQSEEYRQGFEVEGRSAPWHDLSLAAGFTYSDVRDKKSDSRISFVPISTTKLSLQYTNHELGLRAMLTGSHVDWPSDAGNSVHDRDMYWDLHLTQKLSTHGNVTTELFLSGRNLFNNAQYIDDFRKNAPRWFEGGMRVKF
ncbi:MAG: TonB-dependent receptor [Geobacteraceae bacterium]|nr:TonB-dependent receptor [Geobacteraceae bacterium]